MHNMLHCGTVSQSLFICSLSAQQPCPPDPPSATYIHETASQEMPFTSIWIKWNQNILVVNTTSAVDWRCIPQGVIEPRCYHRGPFTKYRPMASERNPHTFLPGSLIKREQVQTGICSWKTCFRISDGLISDLFLSTLVYMYPNT